MPIQKFNFALPKKIPKNISGASTGDRLFRSKLMLDKNRLFLIDIHTSSHRKREVYPWSLVITIGGQCEFNFYQIKVNIEKNLNKMEVTNEFL